MRTQVQTLQERLVQLSEKSNQIQAKADAEGRSLTRVEQSEIDSNLSAFEETKARLATETMNAEMNLPLPRKTGPQAVVRARGSEGTSGFNSPGEFFASVRAAATGQVDARLLNTASTYGSESGPGGSDGGFAVPSDWRRDILELVAGGGTLIDQLNPIVTSSNQVILPVDENSAHASTGITAEWAGEAATITPSKPALKQVTINLFKVAGLVHLSDELVEDSPATGAYALRILAKKIRSLVEDALVAGNGLAKPLGLLNAPGLVTQAKSATGSTAITATDLGNMVSRMVPDSFANAFWLCHSTVLPKLWAITLGQQPVLVPDFTKSPFGTLLGRPVFTSESCSDYNTAGDIFLVSPDGYGLALKSGGMKTDTSIHFAFDQGLQSFRATMRIGGTPLLSAPIARRNGSATLSHIVNLAVRS